MTGDDREPVFRLAGRAFDHDFPFGVRLTRFWAAYEDVPGRRRDGSAMGVRTFWWILRQLFWATRAVGVWVLLLITIEMPERVSIRGDMVYGPRDDTPGDGNAAAFADAGRRGWRLWRTPWLLWSDELVVLVRTEGRRNPKLVKLWSGRDEAKPDIDTDTGELTWPDGSSLQLDMTDHERHKRLFFQY